MGCACTCWSCAARTSGSLICKDSLNYFSIVRWPPCRARLGCAGCRTNRSSPTTTSTRGNLDVELPGRHAAHHLLPTTRVQNARRANAERCSWSGTAHELRRPGRPSLFAPPRACSAIVGMVRRCENPAQPPACVFRELPGHGCVPPAPPPPQHGWCTRRRAVSCADVEHRVESGGASSRCWPLYGPNWARCAPPAGQSVEAVLWGKLGAHTAAAATTTAPNSCAGADDDGFRLDCVAYRHPPLRPLCIEFNGCYMHAQLKVVGSVTPTGTCCWRGDAARSLLWARTQQRAWELAELHGMEVLSVWECQFRRTLRTNTRLRKLYKERCVDVPGPLDLRKHALFGGRVEPFWLLHKCAPDEEIVYIDIVVSVPVLHEGASVPHRHTARVDRRAAVAGRRPKCLKRLLHLQQGFVLLLLCHGAARRTTRSAASSSAACCRRQRRSWVTVSRCCPTAHQADGRLIFGLCARCADLRQQRICHHAERERAWTAAYTHAELNRALSIGYRVLNVHEVWHYERWASPDNGNGLFTEYVNTFLRLKAEASGWPSGCDTEAARAEHIRQFAEQEGIHLRPDNIGHNPGLRQLAKDLLNSLWGKMAERPERDEEVVSFTHLNDQLDRCVVRKREPFARAPEHNNLAVACFVTSHARLYLYDWLEEVRRVGGRSLYCDTDSVLYVKQRGAEGVREGNALGDMKRELPGRRIIDFFAAGPKNYGFQHVDACTGGDLRAERKVRSFELNYAADQQLQYERMRQLVINHFGGGQQNQQQQQSGHAANAADGSDGQEERTISVPCQRFVRNRQADIFTRRSTRVYRPVYTKGRVLRRGTAECVDEEPPQSIRTCPFGWSCRDGGGASPDSPVMNEEEEEEEPMQMAPSAADHGEEDRWREHVWPNDIGDDEDDDDEPGPERKRARVEQCVAPPSPPPSPLREPDAEPEPVAGCSTWDQTTRHTKHICRNNF
ncbi:hypothetical protein niasHT_018769 [Heterodera trifolii]|uniref:DNA-directed DNA polymerase n=1 Tax=Heterodera trifolii TaxID=157864 RepID=A0ABD2KYR6_9BILA